MSQITQILERWNSSQDIIGAKRLARELVCEIGPGFHPETGCRDYVDVDTDEKLFAIEVADRLDSAIQEATYLLQLNGLDICEVALPIQRKILYRQLMRR